MKTIILGTILAASVVTVAAMADDYTQSTAVEYVQVVSPNPDRVRVAGSTLILKSTKAINENSIPTNIIFKPESDIPTNSIVNGTVSIIGQSLSKN